MSVEAYRLAVEVMVPSHSLGFFALHDAFSDVVVQIWLLIYDSIRHHPCKFGFSNLFIRANSRHARVQSSAPDIQFPLRS
jgi:hypothetical protein